MPILRNAPLLRQFLAVVREGSLSAAANGLSVTQPALTKSIQKLEAELGVRLFERLPRGIALTKYGEALLPHAQRIDTECSIADLELQAFGQGQTGRLRIGMGALYGATLVPQAVAAVHAQYPALSFELTSDVTEANYPRLLAGELDIIFGALPQVEPLPEFLSVYPMRELHTRVVAGKQHPLMRKKKVSQADLMAYPWAVLHFDRQIKQRLHAVFGGGDTRLPRIGVELSSLNALVRLLCSGPYLACFAELLPLLQPQLGIGIVPYAAPVWSFETGAVMHASLRRYRPATLLIDLVKEAAAHPL